MVAPASSAIAGAQSGSGPRCSSNHLPRAGVSASLADNALCSESECSDGRSSKVERFDVSGS
jgi:hypothetical protein